MCSLILIHFDGPRSHLRRRGSPRFDLGAASVKTNKTINTSKHTQVRQAYTINNNSAQRA